MEYTKLSPKIRLSYNMAATKKMLKILGYETVIDEDNKEVYIEAKDGTKAKFVLSEPTRPRIDNGISDTISYAAELVGKDNSTRFEFVYEISNSLINLVIYDNENGKTEVKFKFRECIPLNKPDVFDPVLTSVNIKMHSYSEPGLDKIISYSKNDNSITFIESNKYHAKEYQIGLSLQSYIKSVISFKTIDGGTIYSITSTGDENSHISSQGANLPDETFDVTYSESRNNGAKIIGTLHDDNDFKHYTNKKIVNNKNIRKFIDEVIGEFKEKFPNYDPDIKLFLGELFASYLDGEESSKLVADRILSKVHFKYSSDTYARKRKGNKTKKNS